MKKILKRILITLSILIGVIILFTVGYMIKAYSEVKTMAPLETGKITGNIYAVKDAFVNIYIVQSDSGYVVFDAGNNLETIKEELKKLEISPNKVIALFLTHTDGDHIASIPLFSNAKIYLSEQEEQMINGTTSRFLFFGNSIQHSDYCLVKDNQCINLAGLSIKGILTPGHTPGSMCYLMNNRYLFTGDALSLINWKVNEFNNFFNMDTKTQIASIDKLSKLENVEYLFTAHHGMSNDFAFAFSNWNNE